MNNNNNNNKKRKNDNLNNSNNSINNDNNNDDSSLTFKRFKQAYNDKSSYSNIKSVASSLGLSISGTKLELYNRISNYLESRESTIKQVNEKDNMNSFNKIRERLAIKDGLDAVEVPFWDVFRNKSIFKSIFSNFKWSSVKSYDDIIGVDSTLNNYSNGIEIIKDKVKSNQLHIFKNNNEVIKVLQVINKDTKENREFYNQLYKSYSPNNKKNQFKNIQYWFMDIISSNNITALSQYISQFKLDNKFIIKQLESFNSIGGSYQGIKLFNYLKSNQYLSNDKCIRFKLLLKYLYDESLKFKQLIKSYKVIISNYTNYNSSSSNKDNKDKYNKIIQELSTIELNQFTSQQLNSTIQQLIKQHNNNNNSNNSSNSNNNTNTTITTTTINNNIKQILYKYYKVINSISQIINRLNNNIINNSSSKPIEYYIYFKDKSKVKEIASQETYKLELKYQDILYELVYKESIESKNQFIDLIIKSYTSKNAMGYILQSNELELVQLYTQRNIYFFYYLDIKLIKTKQILEFIYHHSKFQDIVQWSGGWKYASSLEILEYFEELMEKDNKKFTIESYCWSYSIDVELLYRAFNNETSVYNWDKSRDLSDCSKLLNHYIKLNKEELIFQHLSDQEGYGLFDIDGAPIEILEWIFKYYSKQDLINMLKHQLSNNITERGLYYLSISRKSDGTIINSGWCYGAIVEDFKLNNSHQDPSMKSLFIDLKHPARILIALSCCGKTEIALEILKELPELTNKSYHQCKIEYIPAQSIDSLIKFIANNIKKDQLCNTILYDILLCAAKNGYMESFKRIIFNYPYLLKVKSGSGSSKGIFSSQQLYKIVEDSKDSNNQLFELLLVNVSISKKEIKKLNSDDEDDDDYED